jgi:hypothetical protein
MMMLAAMVLLTGCKTIEYVPVETVRTDTVKIAHIVTDSVFVEKHDSVVSYVKGDTVTIEKWHWRDRWRDKVSHDTIYKSRVDTVTVVKPVGEATEKLTKWQRTRIKIANWLLWAVGALVVAIVVRFIWRLKSR